MAEGARLESVYTATYRGFESPPHRHILRRARTQVRAFFSHVAPTGGDENPRPGFDYWQRQLDRPRARERADRRGERSESIPPHRHIRDESLYASTGSFLLYSPLGDENPDRGSTTGNASWTDREPASGRAAPTKTPGAFLNNACVGPAGARPMDGPSNGERSESIPPHRHILRRARTQVRAFFRMWHRRHPRGRHQCLSRATRPYPPGSPLCAAPPEGPPKTTKPGLARALLTV